MAKSSLLMRADPSGGGSRRLLMVARSSLNSAWRKKRFEHLKINSGIPLIKKNNQNYFEHCTGVTVSFFRAELYCSSDRRGSPLGKVRRGDLVAISHTPSYHSSGQSPKKTKYISRNTETCWFAAVSLFHSTYQHSCGRCTGTKKKNKLNPFWTEFGTFLLFLEFYLI